MKKRTRALNQDKTKAIIESAITEFERVGYVAANMDRIAQDANVAKATIYKHFGNKKNLFMAIMVEIIEILYSTNYIKYDNTIPLNEQLRTFATQIMEFLNNPKYVSIMKIALVALMSESEVTQELQGKFKDKILDNFIEWLQNAKSDNKLKIDSPEYVASQFFGAIKTHAFYPQIFLQTPTPDKIMQDIIIERSIESILCQYEITDRDGK